MSSGANRLVILLFPLDPSLVGNSVVGILRVGSPAIGKRLLLFCIRCLRILQASANESRLANIEQTVSLTSLSSRGPQTLTNDIDGATVDIDAISLMIVMKTMVVTINRIIINKISRD